MVEDVHSRISQIMRCFEGMLRRRRHSDCHHLPSFHKKARTADYNNRHENIQHDVYKRSPDETERDTETSADSAICYPLFK